MINLGYQHKNLIQLPLNSLLRHTVCLGSSGSGKTVACKIIVEDCLLNRIPVIAVDPQGDIASFLLSQKNTNSEIFHQHAEVVLWTPGSSVGVPLCINPLDLSNIVGNDEERTRIISSMASNLVALLGYDLRKDTGQLFVAYLDLVFQYLAVNRIKLRNTDQLVRFLLNNLPYELALSTESLISKRQRKQIGQKLRMLGIGSKKLIFQHGVPLDIDTLLTTAPTDGRTRLSVIYLNTLHSQEEKNFFLSQLAQSLYQWMLKNPSNKPQVLFYMDEVAPFLPPIKKTACKDTLKLLFKQARKYGLACLIASQNPGDIDYNVLSQFNTWLLGRISMQQDLKKIKHALRSSSDLSEMIMDSLPALKPGEFIVNSPDVFERAMQLKTRWLHTIHKTLDESAIESLVSDTMREYYKNRQLTKTQSKWIYQTEENLY